MSKARLEKLARKYGKYLSMEEMKAENRSKNKVVGEGENKSKPKGYFERFNHKQVVITLLNGETLRGKLHTNRYNKYDVLLENSNGKILIPKHSILYMMEISGGDGK